MSTKNTQVSKLKKNNNNNKGCQINPILGK